MPGSLPIYTSCLEFWKSRRNEAAFVLFLATSLFAQPQTNPAIADPASRNTISLDGMWNTIVDPYESGIPSRYSALPGRIRTDTAVYSIIRDEWPQVKQTLQLRLQQAVPASDDRFR